MTLAAIVITVLFAPIVYMALLSRSDCGYFADTRCICGHNCYIHIKSDGYHQYSPGHQVPEHRSFDLRRGQNGEWELLALAPPAGAWSPVAEGDVVARIRFHDKAMYMAWSGNNWERHARIYNPWPIWIAQVLRR